MIIITMMIQRDDSRSKLMVVAINDFVGPNRGLGEMGAR